MKFLKIMKIFMKINKQEILKHFQDCSSSKFEINIEFKGILEKLITSCWLDGIRIVRLHVC